MFIVIDLFCGAGGTTTGFAEAQLANNLLSKFHVGPDYKNEGFQKICKIIACVNHDHKAILSHWANHPDVKHYEEDIRSLELTDLVNLVNFYRKKYPNAYVILWASLECTNFSKAKGGLARDADSRTLAETLYQHWDSEKGEFIHGDSYIQLLQPDYVMIENVVEFLDYGPLRPKIKNGKPVMIKNKHGEEVPGYEPIPERKGEYFEEWKAGINALGYTNEWTQINSANHGAYTSRNRLFGVFMKEGLSNVWPLATHEKKLKTKTKGLQKWKAVKDVLDFSDEGTSIFNRKKDPADKSLERVLAGLIKFVAKGDKSFITKYYSGKPAGKNISVEGPAGTITTIDGQALVQPLFISKYNGGNPESRNTSLDEPCRTITVENRHALVQGEFIVQRNTGEPQSKIVDVNGPARTITGTGGNQDLVQPEFLLQNYAANSKGDNVFPVDQPGRTVTTRDATQLVQPKFLDVQFGNGYSSSIEKPAPTLTTKDRCSLVEAKFFMDKQYSGYKNNQSIDVPAGTILTNDKHALVKCEPFLMPTNFSNIPKSIEEPSPTITADGHYHYIVNPGWHGNPTDVTQPCPVIIARQDKSPLSLITAETGEFAIPVYDTDSEVMIKIKIFMSVYGLVDIKMRMLKVNELLKIQGFPPGYRLSGSQKDQKKFIGNSVVPLVPQRWIESLAVHLIEENIYKLAA